MNQASPNDPKAQAAREILYVEQTLAKTGDTVLTDTLRDARKPKAWAHYPDGDVFDPATGAQWYYHSHGVDPTTAEAPDHGEHGHFHCFVRPQGAKGPVHHLIAIAIDATGRPLRLFTVNQWVVGDDWLAAPETAALLARFDVQLARPSYLVNRWLSAMIRRHADDIAALLAERDARLAAHRPADPATKPHEDHALEVTSERTLDPV